MVVGNKNNRREKRDFFCVTVELSYSKIKDFRLDMEKGSAITTNISNGGLGIYTESRFYTGQAITVQSRHIGDRPISAEVKWCNKLSENMFKVGLMFTDTRF